MTASNHKNSIRRIMIAGGALIGATAIGIGAAQAAPAPAEWTGYYVGGHIGDARLSGDFAATSPSCAPCEVNGLKGNSLTGGMQAGYNWQNGNFVFGLEADASAVGIDEASNSVTVGGVPGTRPSFTRSVNWTATVSARAGILANQSLIYAKGGAAAGNFKVGHNTNSGATYESQTSTRSGWLLGLGVETAFSDHGSWRIEYDYMDFGKDTSTFTTFAIRDKATVQSVRVGVNYRF
jgi:outer membrane immunogenic protein